MNRNTLRKKLVEHNCSSDRPSISARRRAAPAL
jgi:hypothetical protein